MILSYCFLLILLLGIWKLTELCIGLLSLTVKKFDDYRYCNIGHHYVIQIIFPNWAWFKFEKAVYDYGLWKWDLDLGFIVLHRVNNSGK